QVLHDAEKRKVYDRYGKEGVFASAGRGGEGRGSPFQGFQGGMPNFADSQGGPGEGASFFSFGGGDGGFTDPRELFEELFGGGRGVGGGGGGGGGGAGFGGDASSLFGSLFG
ncbi:unnamed protein product, partial [Hapterophycus canaliculatus]